MNAQLMFCRLPIHRNFTFLIACLYFEKVSRHKVNSKKQDTWWTSKGNVANCKGPTRSNVLAWLSYRFSLKAERKKHQTTTSLFNKYHCRFLQSEQTDCGRRGKGGSTQRKRYLFSRQEKNRTLKSVTSTAHIQRGTPFPV